MTVFADRQKIKTNSPQALRSGRRSPAALRQPHLAARHPVSNQAAQKFAQTCPLALPSPVSCPFGGICHSCPLPVQAQLKVGQPGDLYEQEADRRADRVLEMRESDFSYDAPRSPPGNPGMSISRLPLPALQRQFGMNGEEISPSGPSHFCEQIGPSTCVDRGCSRWERICEPIEAGRMRGCRCVPTVRPGSAPLAGLEERETFRAKETSGRTPEVSPGLIPRLTALQGGGQPLSSSLRNFFEPRFGYDFSQVRVHTGGQATEIAEAVKARAFTLGRNVVFNEREFAPETHVGKKLIAHELTHVVQQQGGLAQSEGNFRKVNMISDTAPPGQLMRTINYGGGCSARLEEVEGNVPRAQRSAARWARVGVASLADPDSVASFLRRHFNIATTNTAAVTQINGSLSSIAGHLEAEDFSYDCVPASDSRCQEPDGPYAGFARAGGFSINFCSPFPYQDFFGHKSLIDTILHEAAHAHDTEFDHDTYENNDDYPGPNPLTNADSYAGFARDAALGQWGYGMPSLELTLGRVMSTTPAFYIATGYSVEAGGPALDVFNMIVDTRLFYTQEGEQPGEIGLTADVGVRINPIRQRVYVDLTTGTFVGYNFTDRELMSGIANRVSAGYRGESMDLGLELSHIWDLVENENLVIVGVRGAYRFP